MSDKIARGCPFHGFDPNIMEVDYAEGEPRKWLPERGCWSSGWVVECKQMGCIFRRSIPYATLAELLEDWNERTGYRP